MNKKIIIITWALTLATTLYVLTAHAQTPSADLLHRAYELRLTGHDESALPLLEQAYAMDHSARVAAQLGLCDEAVGRWDDAGNHLHEALATPNDPWVARHLEALQAAYATVLSHFPRESSARPMTSRAPDDSTRNENNVNTANSGNSGNNVRNGNSAVAEGSIGSTAPTPGNHLQRNRSGVAGSSSLQPTTNSVAALGYAAVIAGGVFMVGGIVSWAVRESIVDSFNGRGCRIGDPMPAAGCDAAGAISGRNTTTALAAIGLTAGGVIEIAGIALLLLHRREESFPQHGFTIASGPGDVGVSVVGRF